MLLAGTAKSVPPTAHECPEGVSVASFSEDARPPACWRPYSAESPFNVPIPRSVPAAQGAEAGAGALAGSGPISHHVVGDAERDYGIAIFYAGPEDPIRKLHCVRPWGRCEVEGREVPVPAQAVPSGVWPLRHEGEEWDSHLTVIDTSTGVEYDLWNVRGIDDGTVEAAWGGHTPVWGDGLGSDAVAARYGSLAGVIRFEELEAGRINHALALNVPCTVGFEYPALKGGLECEDAGMSTQGRPAMGTRLQLELNRAEVRRAPLWKRGILRALDRYGAYVADTTGVEDQWSLKFESPAGYTAFGQPDPYVELAKRQGLSEHDFNENGEVEYWFDLASGVDWSRLRVVPAP